MKTDAVAWPAGNFARADARPRNGLVRRTRLGMALEFVPDDQMLPAK